MSHILQILILHLTFVFTQTAQVICNSKTVLMKGDAHCLDSDYVLDFEDDFNGNSIDSSKWEVMTGELRDLDHSIAQQWYNPKNVLVNNGTLKLIVTRDVLLNQCYNTYFNNGVQTVCEDFFFSAGQINSIRQFSHGIIEMSCKIPKARGVGSSFWMYGAPPGNELDIFEFENEYDQFGKLEEYKLCRVQAMNTRVNFYNNKIVKDCASHYTGPDFSKEFHLFSIKWTPQKLEWYTDGELKRTIYLFYTLLGQPVDCKNLKDGELYSQNKAFPMIPMNIIIDNIVQSNKKAPDNEVIFPVYYEIDYIRFYKQKL